MPTKATRTGYGAIPAGRMPPPDANQGSASQVASDPTVITQTRCAQIIHSGVELLARSTPATGAHIGGSGAAVAPHPVTFRDRGRRLQQLQTAAAIDRGSGPTGTAAMKESGGERAWPLIMTWCPDKRAVNTGQRPC